MKTTVHLTQAEIEQAIRDYLENKATTGYYYKMAGEWKVEWLIEAGGVACDAHNEIVPKDDSDSDN